VPVKSAAFRMMFSIRRLSEKCSSSSRLQTSVKVGGWIDGNRDFSIPRLLAPGYTTVDLAADYAVTSQVTVGARLSNLFDERYQTPVGFLGPGRGAFAELKARL